MPAEMQWIMGCGTGRCGTSTLAHLLNHQHGARISHERFTHKLHWGKMDGWMEQMIHLSKAHPGHIFGDVALQWGSVAEPWLDYGAQVVVLKRDLAGHLASWKQKAGSRNNWQRQKDGGTPGRSHWYQAFPNFRGCKDRHQALIKYWHYYYDELIPPLIGAYPGQVAVFKMEVFNSAAGQRRLLDFCKIPTDVQRLQVGLKKNQRRNKK